MTFLSVDEQNAAIRRLFPDFRLTANADWIGVWEGPLRPASKTYTIRIVYFRRKFFDGWFLSNSYVTVHVVDPLIGKLMLDGNILPHIYWNDRAPLWPAQTRARRARFHNDEFHRIGRRTGVFGSYLWTGAALKDCSQRLFSPSSSDATSAAHRSPDISISSPALLPEASSPSVSERA